MKKLFTFFLLVCTSFLSAQNYKTIDPNRELYYADASNNVFAILADSIEINGADTNYYSFKTLREDTTSWNTMDSCHYYVDDSWMGRKVIIKPNGYNVFINENNDSIFINTQANFGELFKVYTYPNGDSINAIVTNTDTATILGVVDSVKTYTLFSNNNSFNLSPSEIKIGKISGLITMFSFFKFPNGNKSLYYKNSISDYNYFFTSSYNNDYQLVGKSNPKVGVTKLTNGDIYNYDVGDEFNSSLIPNYFFGGGYPVIFSYNKILNKYYSTTNDTVFYDIQYYSKTTNIDQTTFPPTFPFTTSSGTTTVFYTNLNDFVTGVLPERYAIGDSVLAMKFVRLNIDNCGGISTVKEFSDVFPYSTSNQSIPYYLNECFESPFELSGTNYCYQSGVGIVLENEFDPTLGTTYLFQRGIYKKGNKTCGTIVTGINDIKNKTINFSIYPNPAKNSFNYSIDSFEKIDLEIMDVSGKMVLVHHQIKAVGTIDISTLKAGIYFVKGISENGATILKLIVN